MQYWSSGNDWTWIDGRWHETSDPTMEEVAIIEGKKQKLGFGEFADYTYMEILTWKPQYAAFLMNEG